MCYNEQKIKIFEVLFRYFLVSFGSPITVLFGSVLFGAFWAPAGALSVLDLVLSIIRNGSAGAFSDRCSRCGEIGTCPTVRKTPL